MVAVHEKLVREELEGVHRVLCGRVGEARQLRRRGGAWEADGEKEGGYIEGRRAAPLLDCCIDRIVSCKLIHLRFFEYFKL